jgi:hypothetical protein
MNEKINKLWDQAVNLIQDNNDGDWSLDACKDKFAELIVQECAEFANEHNSEVEGVTLGVGRALKQHFGVEE